MGAIRVAFGGKGSFLNKFRLQTQTGKNFIYISFEIGRNHDYFITIVVGIPFIRTKSTVLKFTFTILMEMDIFGAYLLLLSKIMLFFAIIWAFWVFF